MQFFSRTAGIEAAGSSVWSCHLEKVSGIGFFWNNPRSENICEGELQESSNGDSDDGDKHLRLSFIARKAKNTNVEIAIVSNSCGESSILAGANTIKSKSGQ